MIILDTYPVNNCMYFCIGTYRIDAYNTPLLIKPPVLQNSNKPPLKKCTSYNSPPS